MEHRLERNTGHVMVERVLPGAAALLGALVFAALLLALLLPILLALALRTLLLPAPSSGPVRRRIRS
jgi:hypothetical protein